MSPLHVALIRPPMQLARGNHVTLACPPLGVAYLAAALRAKGHRVTVIDAVGEAPDALRDLGGHGLLRCGLSPDEVAARVPDDVAVVGVSSMFSEEWPQARAVARAVRARRPSAVMVVGGEHASAAPEHALADGGFDACAIGEGEETLAELASRVAEGRDWRGLRGLAWREGDDVRRASRRERIGGLDEIPRPAWDALPLEAYLSRGLGYGVHRGRSVPLLATRGCPFRCTFCSSPQMWTTRWSARDPEAVLDEMADAVEAWRAENFDLYDLTAVVRKDWIVAFCRRLVERGLRVTWQIPAGTRSEALDAEALGWMFRAGCRNVAYAPESGSPAVLARIEKRVNLDRMLASMRAAVAAGLMVKCNLVMGFPDETRAEMLETVALCRTLARAGVHDVNVTPFCPYPGSALFDQLRREGRIGALDDRYFASLASYSDLTRSDSWSAHVTSRELASLRWRAMAEFYGRSFALHPRRAIDTARALYTGRQRTRLDKALHDITARLRPR